MDRTDHLDQIQFELLQAEEHLARIRHAMAALEAAGMYPGLPTERWKDDRYLYLYFPDGSTNGLKLDAKQRLYIGADPARIEEARRRVGNRRRWEELNSIAEWLDRWIRDKETDIGRIADMAKRWPRAKEELLGLEISGAAAPAVPNPSTKLRTGLGTEIAGQPLPGSPNLGPLR